MQHADFTDRPAGQHGYSRYCGLALVALLVLPMAFGAIAEEPREKRTIRNVTPDSIPIIVLPPRGEAKPAPQAAGTPGERITTTVQDDGMVHAGGHRLVLAGVSPLPAGTVCESPTLGRWACGVRAFIALRTLVDGKELRCNTPPDIADGTIVRCYDASTDVVLVTARRLGDLRPHCRRPAARRGGRRSQEQGRGIWQHGSEVLSAPR